MLSLIVSGAAGRMGRNIIGLIHRAEDLELAGAIEVPNHQAIGDDAGIVAGCGTLGVAVTETLDAIIHSSTTVIEFSTPPGTMAHSRICAEYAKPMVIGTTGLSQEDTEELKRLTRAFPCVLAPNMSIGITVLLNVLADMAVVLGEGYDVEIIEAHHRFKADAPSGTALGMAHAIARARGKELDDVGRYGRQGMRKDGEIGLQAVRAGDIVGDHTVLFGGVGERIEITHRAQSRETFAYGALQAARWVSRQSPGLYDMRDVLGLRRAS